MIAVAVVSDLVGVVEEASEGGEDGTRGVWGRNWSSCRAVVVKAVPLTAIKTTVVVWQIITQVLLNAS